MSEQIAVSDGFTRREFLGRAGVLAAGSALGVTVPAASRASAASRADHVGAEVGAFDADLPHQWLRQLYRLVMDEGYVPLGQGNPFPDGFSPTSAARFYGYVGIAMYEAVVAGMPRHKSLHGSLNGMPHMPKPRPHQVLDWPTALSRATRDVARAFFLKPANVAAVDAFHDVQVAARRTAGVPERVIAASEEHGRAVAAALRPWVDADGYTQIRAKAEREPYAPPAGEGLWLPTWPNFGPAIEPYWGEMRPLVLTSAGEVQPAPHVPFSRQAGSAFHEQALHTYAMESKRSGNLDHQGVSRFWTDNPRQSGLPSGHWMLAVGQFAAQHGLRLDLAVEATARTGIALAEAFLSCWTVKYQINLLRPVTYIRDAQHGAGFDPGWEPFVNTPQFPEYTSGHSVSSLAAATVLTDLLGSRGYVDTHDLPTFEAIYPRTRGFTSFMAAAEQAAQSRVYGGIHFPMGVEVGKDQGRTVGQLVLRRVKTRKGR